MNLIRETVSEHNAHALPAAERRAQGVLPVFTRLTRDFYVSDKQVPYAYTANCPLYVVRQNKRGEWLAIAEDEGVVLGVFETYMLAANACKADFRTLPVERGGLGQSAGMQAPR